MVIKTLTKEDINKNYIRFKELLRSTNREGVEDLIRFLDESDFAVAPASTRFHGSFEGGLCQHSLDVYDTLRVLVDDVKARKEDYELGDDTVIISSLCHDLAKINTYEKTYSSKKVYSSNGSKSDCGGNFDWEQVEGYKTIDLKDRFIAGNHEETSALIVRMFVPLTLDEEVAIMHHHFSMGWDTMKEAAMGDIAAKYPLVTLLHSADLISAYMYC